VGRNFVAIFHHFDFRVSIVQSEILKKFENTHIFNYLMNFSYFD